MDKSSNLKAKEAINKLRADMKNKFSAVVEDQKEYLAVSRKFDKYFNFEYIMYGDVFQREVYRKIY